MTVVYFNGQIPFTAVGTYQHAVRNISLRDSHNYNGSLNGLGGVVDFGSRNSWFDNTPGLQAIVHLG